MIYLASCHWYLWRNVIYCKDQAIRLYQECRISNNLNTQHTLFFSCLINLKQFFSKKFQRQMELNQSHGLLVGMFLFWAKCVPSQIPIHIVMVILNNIPTLFSQAKHYSIQRFFSPQGSLPLNKWNLTPLSEKFCSLKRQRRFSHSILCILYLWTTKIIKAFFKLVIIDFIIHS